MRKFLGIGVSIFMLIAFIFNERAILDDPVCGTMEECRYVWSYLKKRLEREDFKPVRNFLRSELEEVERKIGELKKRVTTTGAVFSQDRSFLLLGEAWLDPKGLIWGDTVMESGRAVRPMNYLDANRYCTSIGAQLPTKDEFNQLREYMGWTSEDPKGYSPQVLPNFSDYYWFWSSTPYSDHPDFAYGFASFQGDFDYDLINNAYAVRCVVRPQPH